jgi:hypothetical protein
MPAYVIMQSLGRIGETIEVEAILCEPGVAGFPDRRTDVPVRVRRTSEQALCVDGEPRRIIWGEGGNGTATFLVNGSTRGVHNLERRVALARATELLKQLAATRAPLTTGGEEGVAEPLQTLFDWLREQRECAMTAPRDGVHDDHEHAR